MSWRIGMVLVVVVAALGAEQVPTTQPAMVVDKEKKTITIPAVIAPRKLDYLSEIYPIEVVATLPHPRGQKAHETVVNYEAKPSDVHRALESFGLKAGKPVKGEGKSTGAEVMIYLEIPTATGDMQRIPIEKSLVDKKTGKAMPTLKWIFTGSVMRQPDPNKPDLAYGADVSGTLIGIFPVTDETVIQTNLTIKDEPLLKMETNKKLLPPIGTKVNLIIQAK